MRKIYIKTTVVITLNLDDKVELDDVIPEIELSCDRTDVDIVDSCFENVEVIDSK